MASYCTTTDVSYELNGFTINSSSTPSEDTVEEWIKQESELIKRETGKAWGYEVVENEYYDYDGSGSLLIKNGPILEITSIYKEVNGVDADSESWEQLYEGRTRDKDFYYYSEDGEIIFHGTNKPTAGKKNIKISYAHGYETTNKVVKLIVAKKVALRIISTVINGQTSEEGGSVTVGAISISDPSTFSLQRVIQLKDDIKDLLGKLGTFKTYRITRVY